jgi:hypothetical protein
MGGCIDYIGAEKQNTLLSQNSHTILRTSNQLMHVTRRQVLL